MRHRRPQTGRMVFALCVVLPLATHAQQAPRLTLAPATASPPEEFSSLTSARELKDGRVIVSDQRDGRVVVAPHRPAREC